MRYLLTDNVSPRLGEMRPHGAQMNSREDAHLKYLPINKYGCLNFQLFKPVAEPSNNTNRVGVTQKNFDDMNEWAGKIDTMVSQAVGQAVRGASSARRRNDPRESISKRQSLSA